MALFTAWPGVVGATADSTQTTPIAGTTVSVITPQTYPSCTPGSDTIYASNSGAQPVAISGQIILSYINNLTKVTLQTYSINTTVPANVSYPPGFALVTITYPNLGSLPVADPSTGIKELHVDIQLGNNGGGDYDIFSFCSAPPPLTGTQGCTPGFWKNHTTAWTSVPASPDALVSSVFSGADSSLASATLLQALSFKGGSTLAGAEQILLRAGVAAYLNAGSGSGVNYALSQTDVVIMVNAAIASQDRATITNAAEKLDGYNNGLGGCPINGK